MLTSYIYTYKHCTWRSATAVKTLVQECCEKSVLFFFFTNFFYIYMLLGYPFLPLFPIRFMNCSAGLVCSVFHFISAKNIQLFHNNIQISEFVFTSSCLQEGSCLIYIICVCVRIVVFNTYCVVILFFVLCCQFLWIVYFNCHFGLL